MSTRQGFDRYMAHLAEGLGHVDRHAGLNDYCSDLMLPLSRKSAEPMAARMDLLHASARHQSLHHFVANAEWSDSEMLRRVSQWMVPKMDLSAGAFWIIDDTSFPKKGKHSVGVARQYCGALGKQDNCQVAVSLSLASQQVSVPVAYRLYLPKAWAEDAERRRKAGVPAEVKFATKPQIALEQLETLLAEGAPKYCVLANAAYGVDQAFRQGLSDLGLQYVVGIPSSAVVWPSCIEPLPAKRYRGRARPPAGPRRGRSRQAVSVKDLAQGLAPSAFQTISWRQGANKTLNGRFAAVRARHAEGNIRKARLRPEQWLLIEWPAGETEPFRYYLSNLPADLALNDLVSHAHMRWCIERDYQDLKEELGLGHYEGRGWRGFHHHASLSIAAHGFLVAERLGTNEPVGTKTTVVIRHMPAVPADYIPRGRPARVVPHVKLDRNLTLRTELSAD